VTVRATDTWGSWTYSTRTIRIPAGRAGDR